jgi:hypothetical protein
MVSRCGSGQGVMSTLLGVPSTVKYINNLLEEWLSWIECWKNLLNWTHPKKTLLIYGLLAGVLLVLLLVPTRYLVLMGGLYEFLYKFMPEQQEFPNVIRADNMVASVPSDEDLRRVYYWENTDFLRHKKSRLQVGVGSSPACSSFELAIGGYRHVLALPGFSVGAWA